MRFHRAVPLLLAGLALGPGPAAAQEGPLEPLSFLAGCWELRRGDRVTLEFWMPAAGDLMLGASRTQVAGVTREYEHLKITAKDGEVVYTALPSGQESASFKAVRIDDRGVTFENPEHDFPRRILYRPIRPDSLVGRIEGPGPTGVRGVDFPMRRVRCEAGR